MKRVLLLSYYYPPYTGIEGNRVHSWANFLAGQGFCVTVVTRQWNAGGQHDWKDYFSEYGDRQHTEELSDKLKIVRVPYALGKVYKFFSSLPLSSFYYWAKKIQGHFHIETDAYHSLKSAAEEELKREDYDFIIVTSPPLNIIRLGFELKKKFRVPLIADFRDSFNNHLLNPTYRPNRKVRLEGILFKRKLKKWLSSADMVISVSQAVLDTLPLSSSQQALIVMNGYESDTVNHHPEAGTDKFIISSVGSIYATQEIEFLAEGLALFNKRVAAPDIEIRFVGIGTRKEVRDRIEKIVDQKYLNFTNRVSRQEAIGFMHDSSVLVQIGWKGYKGFCPGKVFEYLAAKRTVLIAPADGDLTDQVVQKTGTGRSVHSIEEMAEFLEEKYREWKNKGLPDYYGKEEKIEKYSRYHQNQNLARALAGFNKVKLKSKADFSG